jgi:hypothetical protein
MVVNCITERVRTVDGQITTYPAMGLSLTYDHRAVGRRAREPLPEGSRHSAGAFLTCS